MDGSENTIWVNNTAKVLPKPSMLLGASETPGQIITSDSGLVKPLPFVAKIVAASTISPGYTTRNVVPLLYPGNLFAKSHAPVTLDIAMDPVIGHDRSISDVVYGCSTERDKLE
ncbi:hypothetical protein BWQ96_06259 [Gracilariopsis chorda]|uniref:Uncharacterized protein n=1 Tax=Gracilariopsis chorda TaxID=448386 RepID=A0A2V3IPK0_9FLOR|nr:hypothetical protein BWQ96_06259 [Gracilariopsis chorda]|eukprot:PXF43983.1 hypothetical protein BWQ96_06259 [Gracilariopsis chorda]